MIFQLQDFTFDCTPWPSIAKYGCGKGDTWEWTVLDKTTLGTSDCKNLCLQHASGDGCCYVSDKNGCFWKAGAKAITGPTGHGLSITCFPTVSSEFYFILSIQLKCLMDSNSLFILFKL